MSSIQPLPRLFGIAVALVAICLPALAQPTALIVAIEDYPEASGIARRADATNEANELAALLRKLGFQVELLEGEAATRAALEEALHRTGARVAGKQDSLFFAFIGAGHVGGDADLLLLADSRAEGAGGTGWPVSRIWERLPIATAGRTTLLIDGHPELSDREDVVSGTSLLCVMSRPAQERATFSAMLAAGLGPGSAHPPITLALVFRTALKYHPALPLAQGDDHAPFVAQAGEMIGRAGGKQAVWLDGGLPADLSAMEFGSRRVSKGRRRGSAHNSIESETSALLRDSDTHPDFKPPRLKRRPVPRYPRKARRDCYGTVTLRCVIDREGRVGKVEVVRRTGNCGEIFDESAIRAAKKARYEPATEEGEPVSVSLQIVLEFRPM